MVKLGLVLPKEPLKQRGVSRSERLQLTDVKPPVCEEVREAMEKDKPLDDSRSGSSFQQD